MAHDKPDTFKLSLTCLKWDHRPRCLQLTAHLCFRVSSKCYNGFAKDCRDLGSTARWPLRKIGCSGSNWLRDGFQMDINYSPKPSLSIFKKHRKLTDVVLFVLPQSFQNDVFLQFVGDHLIPAGSFFRKKRDLWI